MPRLEPLSDGSSIADVKKVVHDLHEALVRFFTYTSSETLHMLLHGIFLKENISCAPPSWPSRFLRSNGDLTAYLFIYSCH